MKYCKTCKYKDRYGDCTSQKLTDTLPDNPEMEIDTDDMLIYSYEEEGEFRVGDKFGCVHHSLRENKTCLIQAENIVEKELESSLAVSKQLKVIEKLTARLLHLEQEHEEKKRIMALPEDDNKSYTI